MKLPSFQFYPGDWMKDPNLRRCSRAARGMWVDMLCLMFECEDRGVLATGGEPWSDEDIAAAVGGDLSDGLACISELLRKGVAHRNTSGAIFSKRMVRDEQIRQERVRAGGIGGSKTQAKHKQTAKQKQSPSSSASTTNKNPALRAVDTPPAESPHSRMMQALQERTGAISDGAAQGKAIKWLLEHGYNEQQAVECLDALRSEEWRTTRVSWLTVQKEIGDWLSRRAAPKKERGLVL